MMENIWNQNYLIDTHCHVLKSQGYENIEEELEKIKKSKVQKIILIGCSIEEAKETVEIARRYPGFVYPSVGLHPEETFKESFDLESQIAELEKIVNENKDILVAIGECGLEYFYLKKHTESHPNQSEENIKLIQRELFKRQIQIAVKNDLPLVIHCREGWNDCFEDLSKFNLIERQWKGLPIITKAIMHSYTDNYEHAAHGVELGYKIGVNGIITFKKKSEDLQEVIRQIISKYGIESIVLETDSPYLSPEPFRGKQNSPINIEAIDEFVKKNLIGDRA